MALVKARFTLNRETATSHDDVELMGLDHPLVQEELGRWRSRAAGRDRHCRSGDVDEPVLLSLWMVEHPPANGERRVVVQPIAVKQDGTRVPAVERQCERYLQAPTATPRSAHCTLILGGVAASRCSRLASIIVLGTLPRKQSALIWLRVA
jgi:hypothetical protein